MALFPNLPGVLSEVTDGGLRVSRPLTGPKVTIIGATDKVTVPVNDPYLLERQEDVSLFDLSNGDPSEITKAVAEARAAGAENIEVVISRHIIPANYAVNTRYADLDETYRLLLNTDVDIVVPVGVYIDSPGLTGNKNFAYQLGDACAQATLNNNTANGVIGVSAPTTAAATTGGLSLNELEAHVAALEQYDTGHLNGNAFPRFNGTTDINGDGIPENYGFVITSDRTLAGAPTDADVVKDSRGNFQDLGAYLSVVATWCRFPGEVGQRLYPERGFYNNSGAAAYAGLIASLPSKSAPTNKVVPGVIPIRNLSLNQANRLAGKRYVSFITKPQGTVVADAPTGAYNISRYYRSDFVRLSTVRIVHDLINGVRAIAEPYIGEANHPDSRAALQNAVDRFLGKMQSTGYIEAYSPPSIISTPSMRVLGEMTIDVVVVPALEIRQITVKVGLEKAST